MAKPQPVAKRATVVQPKADAVADLIDDSRIEQGDGGFLIASASGASAWTIQLGAPPTLAGAKELLAKYRPAVDKVVPGLKAEISPAEKRRKVYLRTVFGFQGFCVRQKSMRSAETAEDRLPPDP
jgi:D-alanyl-D-alanine carboxypeptidase/D-alanyl-D-alanine carboxypeptidase (penicillin-binding protein 5/6)